MPRLNFIFAFQTILALTEHPGVHDSRHFNRHRDTRTGDHQFRTPIIIQFFHSFKGRASHPSQPKHNLKPDAMNNYIPIQSVRTQPVDNAEIYGNKHDQNNEAMRLFDIREPPPPRQDRQRAAQTNEQITQVPSQIAPRLLALRSSRASPRCAIYWDPRRMPILQAPA